MSASTKITDRRRRFRWILPLIMLCLLSACASALAGEGEPGVITVDEKPPQLDPQLVEATELSDVLRTGKQPIQCGKPKEEFGSEGGGKTIVPEVDCVIKAKLTVPPKVANWLGLNSTVLASGVAGDMVEHYKSRYDGDVGRTYFLEVPNIGVLRAKFKRKRVAQLEGFVSGSATVVGRDQVFCGTERIKKSCPVDGSNGGEEFSWEAGEGVLLCYVFRTGVWVGITLPGNEIKCPKRI